MSEESKPDHDEAPGRPSTGSEPPAPAASTRDDREADREARAKEKASGDRNEDG